MGRRVHLDITGIPASPVSPGAMLQGTVFVLADKPMLVKYLDVTLRGVCEVRPYAHQAMVASHMGLAGAVMAGTFAASSEVYVSHNIVLCNRDSNCLRIYDGSTERSSAFNKQFSFVLPSRIPDTWPGTPQGHGFIRYTITAHLVYEKLNVSNRQGAKEKSVKTAVELLVRNALEIQQQNYKFEVREKRPGLLSSGGKVKGILVVKSPSIALGNYVPAHVDIFNNSSRPIRQAKIYLYQEYTLQTDAVSTSPPVRVEVKVEKALISLGGDVMPGEEWQRCVTRLRVPINGVTNASFNHCSFINVRYFVRLKLKWTLGSLKCDVGLTVGTTRARRCIHQMMNSQGFSPSNRTPSSDSRHPTPNNRVASAALASTSTSSTRTIPASMGANSVGIGTTLRNIGANSPTTGTSSR